MAIAHARVYSSPRKDTLKVDVDFIVEHFDFADWKVLYHLLR